MILPKHYYLIVNCVSSTNSVIKARKFGKPLRKIIEFKPNEPSVNNCGFKPCSLCNDEKPKSIVFTKLDFPKHLECKNWKHGALYVFPQCGFAAELADNIHE
ncbi:hypothetical protein GCM10027170_14790 [Aliiglaciecola aliphaticivorans]